MSTPKKAFEGTVDTVASAIGVLWDWLGAEPVDAEEAPSVLGLFADKSEPEANSDVIETEGEGLP